MTVGLNSIHQLRAVGNWATTYLWDILFLNAFDNANGKAGSPSTPYPFDSWFPATTVEEPLFQVETLTLSLHVITTEIPKTTGGRQISLEFHDDYNHSLETWLRDWFKEMFNDYNEVTPLFSAVRILEVARLSPQRTVLHTNRYYVFPKGNVVVNQNSQSQVKRISITLGVAGMELNYDATGTQSRIS